MSDPNALTSEEEKILAELHDIAAKIVNDGEVDDDEVAVIDGWLERHSAMAEKWPFSTLSRLLASVLEDGKVDEHERLQLMSVLSGLSVFSDIK